METLSSVLSSAFSPSARLHSDLTTCQEVKTVCVLAVRQNLGQKVWRTTAVSTTHKSWRWLSNINTLMKVNVRGSSPPILGGNYCPGWGNVCVCERGGSIWAHSSFLPRGPWQVNEALLKAHEKCSLNTWRQRKEQVKGGGHRHEKSKTKGRPWAELLSTKQQVQRIESCLFSLLMHLVVCPQQRHMWRGGGRHWFFS